MGFRRGVNIKPEYVPSLTTFREECEAVPEGFSTTKGSDYFHFRFGRYIFTVKMMEKGTPVVECCIVEPCWMCKRESSCDCDSGGRSGKRYTWRNWERPTLWERIRKIGKSTKEELL